MMILQPGIQAPNFVLPAPNLGREISLAEVLGRPVLLIFFPANPAPEIVAQLVKFAENAALQEQATALIGVTGAGEAQVKELAAANKLTFPLCTDHPAGTVARSYGVLDETGTILPSVLVLDGDGLIRRVYEADQSPALPNPAMAARALKNMAAVTKPGPVRPEDWQLGPSEAPVVILEYADYECKPCGEAYRLLKEILPQYAGQVLWVHRHLPLRHSHPLAQGAAEAAEAAGAQDRFWEMHDRLFEARGALEREQLLEYAREIGLDVATFTEDLDNHRFKEAVNEDFKAAVRNGIKLPPALFINSLPLEGPRTREAICARIDRLLACPAG